MTRDWLALKRKGQGEFGGSRDADGEFGGRYVGDGEEGGEMVRGRGRR